MPLSSEDEKTAKTFISLYKQQMERFHQTQEIEWKVNIAFWTLLAAGTYLARGKGLAICPCAAWVLVFVVVTLHLWWLLMIHKSEQTDKKFWVRYRAEALAIIRGKPVHDDEKEEHSNRSGFDELLWLVPEVGMTALLVSVLAYLATQC